MKGIEIITGMSVEGESLNQGINLLFSYDEEMISLMKLICENEKLPEQ